MDYNEAIDYIENIVASPKPGLERMKFLMRLLDNPQNKLKFIHVAGTNGKGSTCAMLESILRTSGYTTGLYTSPHLSKYNERIKVNNIDISDEEFAQITSKVSNACSKMEAQPSIFEILTAIALCYFESQSLDFVILEVGLGGRFDSTNIIEAPVLSVITSIGIDHTEYLGNTVEQIAKEKGGIIKKNCTTVLCFNSSTVYNVIESICNQKNSKLYFNNNLDIYIKSIDLNKIIFSVECDYYQYSDVVLNMTGEYQIYNATTALTAIKALNDLGFNISKENILNGLKNTFWAGRMEVVSKNPTIILDGAHNIDGINILVKYIQTYLHSKKITLLMGVLKDKEYMQMINNMLNVVDRLVLTQPSTSRAFTIKEFDTMCSNIKLYLEKDISKAFDIAKTITKQDEILICTGSLYLVGELRDLILRRNNND